jgi:hypothetical protein
MALRGGYAQSTQGLISSLGQLEGPEQFLLVAQTPQQAEWISRHRGPNQQLVIRDSKSRWRKAASWNNTGNSKSVGGRLKATLRPSVEKIQWAMGRLTPQLPTVPVSDRYYESLGCDVLHFTTQPFYCVRYRRSTTHMICSTCITRSFSRQRRWHAGRQFIEQRACSRIQLSSARSGSSRTWCATTV